MVWLVECLRGTILILCLLLLLPFQSAGVQPYDHLADSLASLLPLYKEDSTKVILLNRICWEYRTSNPGKSIECGEKALELARNLKYGDGEGRAYNNLGVAYNVIGDYQKALEYYIKAGDISLTTGNLQVLMSTRNNIGKIQMVQGEYLKALDSFEEALDMAQQLSDKVGQATTLNNIGKAYEQLGQYDRAMTHLLLSLKLEEELGSDESLATTMNNIAVIFKVQEFYEKALDYHERALAINRKIGSKDGTTNCLSNIGALYIQQGRAAEAIAPLEEGLAITRELGFRKRTTEILERLSEAYAAMGRFDRAYLYQLRYNQLYDSLFNTAKATELAALEAQYESVNKEQEIRLLKADRDLQETEANGQRQLIFFLIGILLAALVLSLYIYWNYRAKRKVAEELELERNRALQINKELDTFVYRASHDLMSPLASIEGLLTLAKAEKDPAEIPQYISLIDKSAGRLNHILRNLLEISRIQKGKRQWETVDLVQVTDDVVDSLQHMPGFDQMVVTSNMEPLREIITDKKLITSVLQNLISNAIKYRGKHEVPGKVDIVGERHGSQLSIRISDNGLGIDPELQPKVFDMFFRATEVATGTGLGLYIVKNSVEKMGGEISVESEPGVGTTINITLPVDQSAVESTTT